MGREAHAPFVGKDKFLLNMPLTTGFARKDTGIKKSDIINSSDKGMLTRTQKKDVIKRMISKGDATGYDYYFRGSKKKVTLNSGPWSSELGTTHVVPQFKKK